MGPPVSHRLLRRSLVIANSSSQRNNQYIVYNGNREAFCLSQTEDYTLETDAQITLRNGFPEAPFSIQSYTLPDQKASITHDRVHSFKVSRDKPAHRQRDDRTLVSRKGTLPSRARTCEKTVAHPYLQNRFSFFKISLIILIGC